MTIIINQLTRPTNCDHYRVTYSVNGGAERTSIISRQDVQNEPEDAFDKVIDRIRTYCKENNLTTFTQIRNGIEGRTFQL